MKTKIYHGERYLGRFTCDGRLYTKFQLCMFRAKRAAKNTMYGAIVAIIIGYAFAIGAIMARSTIQPERVYAKETIEVPVETEIPILEKIAFCESGGKHYGKNGQVVSNGNSNGSVDLGWGQINLYYWGKQATLMGYDLTKEADNKAFTRWLFVNYGDSPWSASKHCWSKK